jgi:hypothetical protein
MVTASAALKRCTGLAADRELAADAALVDECSRSKREVVGVVGNGPRLGD